MKTSSAPQKEEEEFFVEEKSRAKIFCWIFAAFCEILWKFCCDFAESFWRIVHQLEFDCFVSAKFEDFVAEQFVNLYWDFLLHIL